MLGHVRSDITLSSNYFQSVIFTKGGKEQITMISVAMCLGDMLTNYTFIIDCTVSVLPSDA